MNLVWRDFQPDGVSEKYFTGTRVVGFLFVRDEMLSVDKMFPTGLVPPVRQPMYMLLERQKC